MGFYKTVNLILEESTPKPKYEKISPREYSRVYMETGSIRDGYGYISTVSNEGVLDGLDGRNKNSKEVEKIKKKWKPAIMLHAFEIVSYVKPELKEMLNKSLKKNDPGLMDMYIINDASDIVGIDIQKLHNNYWLEPTVTYKDYTSKETADVFDKFVGNL
jgi:hypothetical protein